MDFSVGLVAVSWRFSVVCHSKKSCVKKNHVLVVEAGCRWERQESRFWISHAQRYRRRQHYYRGPSGGDYSTARGEIG